MEKVIVSWCDLQVPACVHLFRPAETINSKPPAMHKGVKKKQKKTKKKKKWPQDVWSEQEPSPVAVEDMKRKEREGDGEKWEANCGTQKAAEDDFICYIIVTSAQAQP